MYKSAGYTNYIYAVAFEKIAYGGLAGAGVGAGLGALGGGFLDKENRLRGAALGSGAGMISGAGAGALLRRGLGKKPVGEAVEALSGGGKPKEVREALEKVVEARKDSPGVILGAGGTKPIVPPR